jgi:hypothetical protein
VIAFGFIIHRRLLARFGSDLTSAISLAAFFVLSLLIAVSASGQLITDVLGEVGPSWWRFPLVLSGELALGMALSKGAIVARDRLREKLKEREEGEGQEP